MPTCAVISYTRSTIGWAVVDWDRAERKDSLAASLSSIRKKIEDSARMRNVEKLEGDPKPVFDVAVEEIRRQLKARTMGLDQLCITGHGPFAYDGTKAGKFGTVTTFADGPFSGKNLLTWAEEAFPKLPPSAMEVITDVEALAIDAFWAEVKTSKGIDLAALHDEPIISAAFIVARGIGGAIARSPGYILRGKHHAEMGHFPVSPHASDPLPKSACDMHPGGQCVTSRASLVALAGRAEAFGMNLSELFTDRSRARDDRWTEFWSIEASYLGQLFDSSLYTAAPTHIVMAGTIIESAPFLIPMIQKATLEYLGGGRVDDDPYRRLMTGDFIKAANRYKGQIHGAILHQLRGELTQSS